jgi:hypothetical protein
MARYVLVSDPTLSREYNDFPLLDLLSCAPCGAVPEYLYNLLEQRGRQTTTAERYLRHMRSERSSLRCADSYSSFV